MKISIFDYNKSVIIEDMTDKQFQEAMGFIHNLTATIPAEEEDEF